MKTLAVSVLLFAAMVLTGAAPKSELQAKRSELCPATWTKIGNRCFFYVPALLNWAMAEKNCQSMKANLASVHSRKELRRIQVLIGNRAHEFGETWLGGTDCQIEGVWLWSDGTRFNYNHCDHFDNYLWNQHCMIINYGVHRCWEDERCTNKYPSVCAKNI